MKRRSSSRSRVSSRTSNNQQSAHAVLRVCFAVFLFLYFYLVQGDAISLLQHKLSGGATTYNPIIGSVILTILLVGLQWLIIRVVSYSEKLYVLSFLPSALLATLPTALFPDVRGGQFVVMVLLLAAWTGISVFGKKDPIGRTNGNNATPWGSHAVWLFLLMLFMGLGSGSNDTMSYEVKTSRLLLSGDYAQAAEVGKRSLATSDRLTALRAYALSHEGKGLGATLFAYPLPSSGSAALLLRAKDSLNVLFAPDSLYAYLQSPRPTNGMKAADYFRRAAEQHPQSAARDYWLCALLLDRDLERFVEELPHYYDVSDSATLSTTLPRYYVEAIVLHNRLATQDKFAFDAPNVTANYLDFKEKEKRIADVQSRRNLLWREYGDTYWWYYSYGTTNK